MQTICVPYGKGTMEASFPDDVLVNVVDPPCVQQPAPLEELIQNALDHPIGTEPLEQMAHPALRYTIVVNDHTRPGPCAPLVQAVVQRLERAGVPDENITFLIATGSHRASTPEELNRILGEELHRRIRIVMHQCDDRASMVYLGKTCYDMPIWVNRAVVETDFVITTGLIAPHHSAGFSGGRKSIVPGVAGLETLKIHHSLPIRQFEPAMGNYEHNPFHLAALEAAKKTNVRFILNVVQDPHKTNVACVAGDLDEAHQTGVEICRRVNTIEFEGAGDIVIASPGGFPRDSTLYQAQKALSVAEVLANPSGATLILCARGEDGYGEGLFRQWMMEAKTPEEVIERYRAEGFNVGNNKAFMFARALTKGRVVIVSDHLKKEDLNEMMLDWAPNLQTAIDEAMAQSTPRRVIVLPSAVNVIPVIQKA